MDEEDLADELQALGEHPCRVDLPFGATLRQAAVELRTLRAERDAVLAEGVAMGIEAAAGEVEEEYGGVWEMTAGEVAEDIRNLSPAVIIAQHKGR